MGNVYSKICHICPNFGVLVTQFKKQSSGKKISGLSTHGATRSSDNTPTPSHVANLVTKKLLLQSTKFFLRAIIEQSHQGAVSSHSYWEETRKARWRQNTSQWSPIIDWNNQIDVLFDCIFFQSLAQADNWYCLTCVILGNNRRKVWSEYNVLECNRTMGINCLMTVGPTSWYCRGPGLRMLRSRGAVATPQCPRGPPMSTSRAAWGSRAGQSDISVIQVNIQWTVAVINELHDDYQLWGIIMSWMWKFHLIMWTFQSWINNRLTVLTAGNLPRGN